MDMSLILYFESSTNRKAPYYAGTAAHDTILLHIMLDPSVYSTVKQQLSPMAMYCY
jgi:hypothetical protein